MIHVFRLPIKLTDNNDEHLQMIYSSWPYNAMLLNTQPTTACCSMLFENNKKGQEDQQETTGGGGGRLEGFVVTIALSPSWSMKHPHRDTLNDKHTTTITIRFAQRAKPSNVCWRPLDANFLYQRRSKAFFYSPSC